MAERRNKREETFASFEKMNKSAKELFFELMDRYAGCDVYTVFSMVGFENIADIKSPIEQMFIVAYYVAMSITGEFYWLNSQEEIEANSHKYIADFCLDNESGKATTKLIVECDGHDFHEKTKEQVNHDNQRDYNLKMQGYEVIHFSGSEIYNNPMKCALKVIDFIRVKEGD